MHTVSFEVQPAGISFANSGQAAFASHGEITVFMLIRIAYPILPS
jgi:hypothetical protein